MSEIAYKQKLDEEDTETITAGKAISEKRSSDSSGRLAEHLFASLFFPESLFFFFFLFQLKGSHSPGSVHFHKQTV